MVSATGNNEKEKSRNLARFLRIKNGLKKKALELSTLVGVDVCLIILDPEQHGQGTDQCPVETGTYPDNSQDVHRIIQRYREYVTTTTRDHEHGVSGTTTGVVVGGSKKKRNNQDLVHKNSAEIRVTSSSSSEQDDAWSEVQEKSLIQALRTLIPTEATVTNQLRCWEQVATAVPGKKTANQCKKKFALLMKGGFSFNSETVEEEKEVEEEEEVEEEVEVEVEEEEEKEVEEEVEVEEEEEEEENEFMGFDLQNVNIDELQRMTEELEELLADSSCTSAAVVASSSSTEFLVEGDDYTWPSLDHLNEVLNGFGDGDQHHEDEECIFDMLPLSPPPLPLTNAFISNRLNWTTHEGVQDEDGSINASDKWLTTRMVEWDQFFI